MDKLAEIKRLYHQATRATIKRDLGRAVELLKSMGTEEERERAAVYMDGLSQLRSDWAQGPHRPTARGRPRKQSGGHHE